MLRRPASARPTKRSGAEYRGEAAQTGDLRPQVGVAAQTGQEGREALVRARRGQERADAGGLIDAEAVRIEAGVQGLGLGEVGGTER